MPIEHLPNKGRRQAQRLASNIVYQIIPERSEDSDNGPWRPAVLGAGRFATVFRAQQRSEGKNIREVAIKILHTNATHADQYLFEQEVELLKDLTSSAQVRTMTTLDIVQLRPMIMCGCGSTYHPYCPECGKHPLQSDSPAGKDYPALTCPDCGYELSGDNTKIKAQYERLFLPPANDCPNCREADGPREGTIVNFVDRPAVVMELLRVRLDQFAHYRREQIWATCKRRGIAMPGTRAALRNPLARSVARALRLKLVERDEVFRQKVMALDKMLLMVQLAEAVAWLHGDDMQVVHKDLTPDNIMVQFVGGPGSVAAGSSGREAGAGAGDKAGLSFRDVLNEVVSHPNFSVRLIDFGLADHRQTSRKWYDEEYILQGGNKDKTVYLSPEGHEPILKFNNVIEPLVLERLPGAGKDEQRFLVPPGMLEASVPVLAGDILAFPWDRKHDHELKITRIEQPADGGPPYAYFEGKPPPDPRQRHYQIVHTLGVAHDIFSLGSIFYYVLTENHLDVDNLRALSRMLQLRRTDLSVRSLRRLDHYTFCRDRIPIPNAAWRDKLMGLILRAVVRGPDSFNQSRTDTGPVAAQRLLSETRRIYGEMQQEILAESRIHRFERYAVVAAAICLLCGLSAGLLIGRTHPPGGQQQKEAKGS